MIQIVLCDDNPCFLETLRQEIRNILKQHKTDAAIHVFQNPDGIPEHILSSGEIFFLDIDFPDKECTGIQIARKIRKLRMDSILIFITNFIAYAPEGYEVQAFRYLLKSEIHPKLESYLMQAISRLRTEQESIQLNISGEPITLLLKEILYVESQGHTAVIHVSRQGVHKTYRFYASLTSLEQSLSPRGFLRIQKSFLVNMRRLKRYQCTGAVLDEGTVLPVSEKNYGKQKQQFLLWKGQQ